MLTVDSLTTGIEVLASVPRKIRVALQGKSAFIFETIEPRIFLSGSKLSSPLPPPYVYMRSSNVYVNYPQYTDPSGTMNPGGIDVISPNGMRTNVVTGLINPTGTSFDSAGNVYFDDQNATGQLALFVKRPGKAVAQLGVVLDLPNDTITPAVGEWAYGTAATSTGVYVDYPAYTDNMGNMIAGGIDLIPFRGTRSTVVSGLTDPSGLAVGGNGTLYYQDFTVAGQWGLYRVVPGQIASEMGTVVNTLASGQMITPGAWSFSTAVTPLGVFATYPEITAIDSVGNTVVVAPGGITEIATSGVRSTVATGLNTPTGVSVNDAGQVYYEDLNATGQWNLYLAQKGRPTANLGTVFDTSQNTMTTGWWSFNTLVRPQLPAVFANGTQTLSHLPAKATTGAAVTPIATIAATLSYPTQVVAYTLSGPSAGMFSINGTTGAISTKIALVAGSTYSFSVTATDSIDKTSISTVAATLHILNIAIGSPSLYSLLTDVAKNSPLSTVAITDLSPTDKVTATVTINSTYGTLSDAATVPANLRFIQSGAGVYTFSGVAATATTAIHDLMLSPVAHMFPVGTVYALPITVSVTDTTSNMTVALSPAKIVNITAVGVMAQIHGAPALATVVDFIGDTQSDTPFASVSIADPDFAAMETVTVTLDNAVKGMLAEDPSYSGPVAFAPGTKPNVYSVSGTPSDVTAALQALDYTPAQYVIAPGDTYVTVFTISVNNGTSTTSNAFTRVAVTAQADTAPTISIGSATSQTTDLAAAVIQPLNGSTITDPDAGNATLGVVVGQTEVLTITQSDPTLGLLRGPGLVAVKTSPGSYTITGTVTVLNNDLNSLTFVPTNNAVTQGSPAMETLSLSVTDGTFSATGTASISISGLTQLTAALASTTLKGTLAAGTAVVNLSAGLDADALTYTLVGPASGNSLNNSSFVIGGNQLLTAGTLMPATYYVQVMVADGNGDSVTQGLKITLTKTSTTVGLWGLSTVVIG